MTLAEQRIVTVICFAMNSSDCYLWGLLDKWIKEAR